MITETSDEDLLAQVAKGDKAAFTGLVARHRRRLTAMTARIIGAAAAEDVVQETFTRAWLNAPAWQQTGSLRYSYAAWLSRVAMNLAIDHTRRRVSTVDIDDIETPDPTADVETEMIRRERMALGEFEDLIDRYGGDAKRWPDTRRAAAATLLLSSLPARKALATMQEVEQLLVASQSRPRDHVAVAARASRGPQDRRFNPVVLKTGWSAAAAALLMLGILVGRTGGIPGDEDPSITLSQALASTETINVE